MTDVLDHGSIKLVDFMGGDHRVDQAAGVSLGRFDRQRDTEQQRKIINYMIKHRHGTPFEHSVFTFHVKCPMFVRTEWMRHRIGSFNEISGRYTQLPKEFYVPDKLRIQDPNNKQGSIEPTLELGIEQMNDSRDYVLHMISAWDRYQIMLLNGYAREHARMVLPVAFYTEFVWTVNARALMNFISLRMTLDAQYEIRVYAEAAYDIMMEKMPLTTEAFTLEGYKGP